MTDDLEKIWEELETSVGDEEVERARTNASDDQVICWECARPFGQITEQHLRTHGMGLGEYEEAYPVAPLYPDDPTRQPGRDPGFTQSKVTKRKIAERTKRNHEQGVYK